MADTKLAGLGALAAAPDVADLIEVLDVSDTSLAATGTNKKLTIANLFASILGAGQIKSSSATAGIGYATGAGSTVTQGTSKSTAVTCNAVTGAITMHNASLTTSVSFTLNSTGIAATDFVGVCHASGGTAGAYLVCVTAVGAGTAQITVQNISGGALGEAIVLRYAVLKAVSA